MGVRPDEKIRVTWNGGNFTHEWRNESPVLFSRRFTLNGHSGFVRFTCVKERGNSRGPTQRYPRRPYPTSPYRPYTTLSPTLTMTPHPDTSIGIRYLVYCVGKQFINGSRIRPTEKTNQEFSVPEQKSLQRHLFLRFEFDVLPFLTESSDLRTQIQGRDSRSFR